MSFGGGGGGTSFPGDKVILANPITRWFNEVGSYPSNSQSWWLYKRPRQVGSNEAPKYYQEVFDPQQRFHFQTGNTRAPSGHYILNAFDQDRTAASGIAGIAVGTSNGARPSAVAFHAGRAFFAGVKTAGFNTKIYFSQILTRDTQVAECFQANDPTSEETPDLLSSDGGVLVVPEAEHIVRLLSIGEFLFIFASNGVWQVGGSEGIGFRANDYSINKISEVPTISPTSFVTVEGLPIWWNYEGIYTLRPDQTGLAFSTVSLTDTTIKQFYDDEIPAESKKYAKAAYNPQTKIVQWVYRSTAPDAATRGENFEYDRIMNLDIRSGAFYPWTVPVTSQVAIRGIFANKGDATVQETANVVDSSSNQVIDSSANNVIANFIYRAAVQSVFKYITQIYEIIA